MLLTFRHLKEANKRHSATNVQHREYFKEDVGLVTLQYPYEAIPVPDNGRYRLHNEIDDCIVCDKCAIICPVNCIEIEAVKSSEPIGETSDGSVKRLYAAKFDIDMAKCCYCGLCTTVCPTECLTMTKTYDFSEFDIKDMTYHFSDLSPEQAEEKKRLYDQFIKEKEEAKKLNENQSLSNPVKNEELTGSEPIKKPAFKVVPKISAPSPAPEQKTENQEEPKETNASKPKPVFGKPIIKPVEEPKTDLTGQVSQNTQSSTPKATAKPVFKPVIKKPDQAENEHNESKKSLEEPPKPSPKPVIKPVYKKPETPDAETPKSEQVEKPKILVKPVMKPIFKKPEPPKDES